MKQSHRLDLLLRRAQDHEDEVARTLLMRQQSLDMHQSRLEELRRRGRSTTAPTSRWPARKWPLPARRN